MKKYIMLFTLVLLSGPISANALANSFGEFTNQTGYLPEHKRCFPWEKCWGWDERRRNRNSKCTRDEILGMTRHGKLICVTPINKGHHRCENIYNKWGDYVGRSCN